MNFTTKRDLTLRFIHSVKSQMFASVYANTAKNKPTEQGGGWREVVEHIMLVRLITTLHV
jgi:hypothetical protein